MLICKFAYERSSLTRIAAYVRYLEEVRQRQEKDSTARQLAERLLVEAQSWLVRAGPT